MRRTNADHIHPQTRWMQTELSREVYLAREGSAADGQMEEKRGGKTDIFIQRSAMLLLNESHSLTGM